MMLPRSLPDMGRNPACAAFLPACAAGRFATRIQAVAALGMQAVAVLGMRFFPASARADRFEATGQAS
ncbi:MAG: hypothetical protein LBI92_11290 [Azoarcus sp.]|jgi:hypothetical protein|nr:hypothetical protein [Azoarcus sp.]